MAEHSKGKPVLLMAFGRKKKFSPNTQNAAA